jgi:hypothetical protein
MAGPETLTPGRFLRGVPRSVALTQGGVSMSIRGMAGRLAMVAVLSAGAAGLVASPAQATAASLPCAPNGYCDAQFCTSTASFGWSNYWYSLDGRNDVRAGWEQYIMVVGVWHDTGEFVVNC